jgi:hypothetical protein
VQFLLVEITSESWSGLACQPCFASRHGHFLAGGGNLKSCEVSQQGSLVYNCGLNCVASNGFCVTVKFHCQEYIFVSSTKKYI